jgi:transposase
MDLLPDRSVEIVSTWLQNHPSIDTISRDGSDAWVKDVEANQLEAFEASLTSVQQDKDAVLAGLTLPWSNGSLEEHMKRLKLIKCSLHGRAKFDVLRLRVPHSAVWRIFFQNIGKRENYCMKCVFFSL